MSGPCIEMAETQDQDQGSLSYRNVTWRTADQEGFPYLQKNFSEQEEILSY